jgi:hypothetical protein
MTRTTSDVGLLEDVGTIWTEGSINGFTFTISDYSVTEVRREEQEGPLSDASVLGV